MQVTRRRPWGWGRADPRPPHPLKRSSKKGCVCAFVESSCSPRLLQRRPGADCQASFLLGQWVAEGVLSATRVASGLALCLCLSPGVPLLSCTCSPLTEGGSPCPAEGRCMRVFSCTQCCHGFTERCLYVPCTPHIPASAFGQCWFHCGSEDTISGQCCLLTLPSV